ncbi:MAG TPA: hypothetical protein VMT62_08755 [Syntrophorhabdaceae bacterium]|nr:hypothetical protein [Syntrophorhabdaceae bacterium]
MEGFILIAEKRLFRWRLEGSIGPAPRMLPEVRSALIMLCITDYDR